MLTPVTQRWREGRALYRPAGEPIDTGAYEVALIAGDATAKAFVLAHHYSGSYPAARRRFGLYRGADLVGVAVFSVPANTAALACLPGEPMASLELGRFVLVDDVPANGETWFLARCFEELRREGFVGVVSFSDPCARPRRDGTVVFPGHVGTIYQASNAVYLGRSKAETVRLLPDGSVLHRRALAKLRNGEVGRDYVEALLRRHGAPERGDEDVRAWTASALSQLVTPLRHGGNHKYAWTLRRADRRHLPASLPYPKVRDPRLAPSGALDFSEAA